MTIFSSHHLARFSLLLLSGMWLSGTTHAVVVEDGPNYATYPITSIPAIGPAGSKVIDPVFGTPIMRLTGPSDGSTSATFSYSSVPVFNKDSTRLWVTAQISGSGRAVLYQFDPVNFTFSNRTVPQNSGGPGLGGNMFWSGVSPDILFYKEGTGGGGYYGSILKTYNAATAAVTLVKDLGTLLPAGYGLNQMSRSIDDDVFAFTLVNTSGSFVGYFVWKRSTNTVLLLNQSDTATDEVQIDKSGRYLNVQRSGGARVWDLQPLPPTYTQLTDQVDSYTHEDTGVGTLFSACGNQAGLCYRQLSSPHTQVTLLSFAVAGQAQDHFSMLADDQSWGMATNNQSSADSPFTCRDPITLPFQCEITQVATNGSGQVRRLVHHYSTNLDYSRTPFGNISRDGQFIAWASDWGNPTGRTDVYIAKIAPGLPPPTGLRVVAQ